MGLFKKTNAEILVEQYKALSKQPGFFKVEDVILSDGFDNNGKKYVYIDFLFGDHKCSAKFSRQESNKSEGKEQNNICEFEDWGVAIVDREELMKDDSGKHNNDKALRDILKLLRSVGGILLSNKDIPDKDVNINNYELGDTYKHYNEYISSNVNDSYGGRIVKMCLPKDRDFFIVFSVDKDTLSLITSTGIDVVDKYIKENFISITQSISESILRRTVNDLEVRKIEQSEKIDKELNRLLKIQPLDSDMQKRFDILNKLETIYHNVESSHNEILVLRNEYQKI